MKQPRDAQSYAGFAVGIVVKLFNALALWGDRINIALLYLLMNGEYL